ncbi:MAG: ABC transporter ATP-binding protein [Nitrososphaerales archaeon]
MTDLENSSHSTREEWNAELIYARRLTKYFQLGSSWLGRFSSKQDIKNRYVHAVDDVTFKINKEETLGLVGESGSGKSTLGRCIVGLLEPTSGTVLFDGYDMNTIKGKDMRKLRRRMQVVFQDPVSSLDPSMRIKDVIAEPLEATGKVSVAEKNEAVLKMVSVVGLDQDHLNRFPHEFSGGQRQRIGIARALITSPDFVLLDEPTSALDASIQAQILNLLKKLKKEFSLTSLFITHNMKVVSFMSDRIAVMYLGRIVEIGSNEEIISEPLHPYTKTLIASIPKGDVNRRMWLDKSSRQALDTTGEIPSPINPPSGCRFHTRCPYAMQKCKEQTPPFFKASGSRSVACYLYE